RTSKSLLKPRRLRGRMRTRLWPKTATVGKNFFPSGCAATSVRILAFIHGWLVSTTSTGRGAHGTAAAKKLLLRFVVKSSKPNYRENTKSKYGVPATR